MSVIRPGDENEAAKRTIPHAVDHGPGWPRWLGMIVAVMVPMIISLTAWIEADTAAKRAAQTAVATAKETATSDLSHVQVVEELNKLKAHQAKRDLEIALLNERALQVTPTGRAISSSTAPTVDEAKAALRFPEPPLPSERPAPTADKVIKAVQAAEAL